jgi:hypothetical protein
VTLFCKKLLLTLCVCVLVLWLCLQLKETVYWLSRAYHLSGDRKRRNFYAKRFAAIDTPLDASNCTLAFA